LGKLESTIKSEIQRLAKREIRSTFIPLRKEVRAMRIRLSDLSKGITSLNRMAKEHHLEEGKPKLEATPEEVKASRLTPERIRRLRKKLGISMKELGILTGSSLSAIVSWEKGKFKPKEEKKATLVALRKVRKREVRKMLAEKATAPEKTRKPKRRPATKARASKKSTRAKKPTARRRKPTAMRLKKAA
jgi:DNA-binding transcriptional regulator YiaG